MNIKSGLHKCVYHIGLFFARFTLKKYDFKHSKRIHLTEPTLVLCNHTTESDMIMVASCFYEHMYIICGEHLLRGKNGPMLSKLFDLIPAAKGASHLPMLKEMTRRLKAGYNILLFPEGSRSFNGITENVGDSIGKLIKISGCALATVHTTGGYFIAPRWAYHFRKGPASAEIKHVISSEELKSMKPNEITDLINADLAEDAYETQRIKHHRYTCEGGLAEGIENFLVICPECGAYDSFESGKDDFGCKNCGLKVHMDEEGFLKYMTESWTESGYETGLGTGAAPDLINPNLRFDTVSDWGKWMETRFDSDMEDKTYTIQTPIFIETDVKLYSIDADAHTTTDLVEGTLYVYGDRFEFREDGNRETYPSEKDKSCSNSYKYEFSAISEAAMLYYGKTLLFTHSSGYFGITGEHFHAWKESRLYRNYIAKHTPGRKMNAQ